MVFIYIFCLDSRLLKIIWVNVFNHKSLKNNIRYLDLYVRRFMIAVDVFIISAFIKSLFKYEIFFRLDDEKPIQILISCSRCESFIVHNLCFVPNFLTEQETNF